MREDSIQINGGFGKWMAGVVATLVAIGVVASVVNAIKTAEIARDLDWIRAAVIEIANDVEANDKRIDENDRRLDSLDRQLNFRRGPPG